MGKGVSGAAVAADPLLAQAVSRLVQELHPERIYLFGSRARGDAGADSDYDFLVVVPERARAVLRNLDQSAYKATAGLGLARDILVYSSAQFERSRPVASSLAAAVEREGRLLYGAPPGPREVLSPMEEASRRAALARQWMTRASQDLAGAKLMADTQPPLFANAVYHCQQAFEKALKGFLAWQNQPLEKTHLLEELVESCARIDPDFLALAHAAATVSPYAIKFRYPESDLELFEVDPPEPTREETDTALALADQAFSFVLARLPDNARP